jgi:hypothetical protein
MSFPQILIELDIPENCIDQKTSASERGRSFVLHREQDETVYRIKVDDCWLGSDDGKKVDYLFWYTNNKARLILVELKGQNLGTALKQIAATLEYLYNLRPTLRQFATQGGICVYIVLSRGKGVGKRLNQIDKLKKTYQVIIRSKSQRLELNGMHELC